MRLVLLHKTQALMGATRLASGKDAAIISRVCVLSFHYPRRGTRRSKFAAVKRRSR